MEVEDLIKRNQRVEADKAWETSWTRKIAITVMTYLVVMFYLTMLGMERVYLHALVPAGGYFLSTLSLPYFKKFWMNNIYKKTALCIFLLLVSVPFMGQAQELKPYEKTLPELDRQFFKDVLELHVANEVLEVLLDEKGLFEKCQLENPAFAKDLTDTQKSEFLGKFHAQSDVFVTNAEARETILIWEKLEKFFYDLGEQDDMTLEDFKNTYTPKIDEVIAAYDDDILKRVQSNLYDTERCTTHEQMAVSNEIPSYLNSNADLLAYLQENHFKTEKYINYEKNITLLLSDEEGAQ